MNRKHRIGIASAVGAAAILAACGGGEVLAVIGFLGSAGGDWKFDNPAIAGFQRLKNCGTNNPPDANCFINIQIDGTRDLFATSFNVRYQGNVGTCPGSQTAGGRVDGDRVTLPNCFSGRYVNINEVVSDSGTMRAYFDSEVPDETVGVWVEIQQGIRRFKFGNVASQRCELTTPRTSATITIDPAVIDENPALFKPQTTITMVVGGRTWSGVFVGMSGMRLTSGSDVMELERRNLPDVC